MHSFIKLLINSSDFIDFNSSKFLLLFTLKYVKIEYVKNPIVIGVKKIVLDTIKNGWLKSIWNKMNKSKIKAKNNNINDIIAKTIDA